jgi:hypothetical protein
MAVEIPSQVREHGETAYTLLDQLSASDPSAGTRLAEIMRLFIVMRDSLIAASRGGDGKTEAMMVPRLEREGAAQVEQLERMNAILSSIFGMEFPSAGLPWSRICETREALRHLLDEAPSKSCR